MDNELRHWGIKGMRWGVRRYQNKDGTLTPAGKKRYDAEMEKLKQEERVLKNKQKTQAKFAKLDAKRKSNQELADSLDPKKPKTKDSDKESSPPKKKGVKDMTDDELIDAIRRSELEKRYRDLNPRQVSSGEKFVKQTVLPMASDISKNLAKDYLTKKGKEILGLKGDDFETLKKATETAEFKKRKVIAEDFLKKREERIKEESKSKDSHKSDNEDSKKSDTKSESQKTESANDRKVYEGTVMGEGTSKSESAGRRWSDGPVVDAVWRDVESSSSTNTGRSYIDDLLGLPSPKDDD